MNCTLVDKIYENFTEAIGYELDEDDNMLLNLAIDENLDKLESWSYRDYTNFAYDARNDGIRYTLMQYDLLKDMDAEDAYDELDQMYDDGSLNEEDYKYYTKCLDAIEFGDKITYREGDYYVRFRDVIDDANSVANKGGK